MENKKQRTREIVHGKVPEKLAEMWFLIANCWICTLVLYREVMEVPMNVVEFTWLIVGSLIGSRMDHIPPALHEAEHQLICIDSNTQHKYALYALHNTQSCTQYHCGGCGIRLCAFGNGNLQWDCFAKAHLSTRILSVVKNKYVYMNPKKTLKRKNQ